MRDVLASRLDATTIEPNHANFSLAVEILRRGGVRAAKTVSAEHRARHDLVIQSRAADRTTETVRSRAA